MYEFNNRLFSAETSRLTGDSRPKSGNASGAQAARAPHINTPFAAARRWQADPAWFGRGVDVTIAALILLATLPVVVLLCLAIWAQDGGRPIFAHRRIGRDGRTFPCFKLRSMVIDADSRLQRLLESDPEAAAEWAADHKLRSDPRITLLGAFLRKSSLDELPQLMNVILGHMSLVGPRPIVANEIPRYGRYFQYYCSVRPGITGLWQVSGRNDVSYRRRVALDTVYCRQKTVSFDMWILGRTIPVLLLSKGSY